MIYIQRNYFDISIDGIKTTSPVSIILDGFTLQTVRTYNDVFIKIDFFLMSIVEWSIIME